MFKGLFSKVYGLILVPSTAFLVLAGVYIYSNYQAYSLNKSINQKIPIVRSSINLLSVLQVERGMSISYVNGVNNRNALIKHREKVDALFNKYNETIAKTEVPIENNKSGLVQSALNMREAIIKKQVSKADIAPIYTRAVRSLMSKISLSKNLLQNQDLLLSTINLLELSEAKENGGLLRANVSALLARNKQISDEDFALINKLNAGFTVYSNKKVLTFESVKSKEKFKVYLNMPEYSYIKKAIFEVLDRRKDKFFSDPKEYFEKISKVLSQLNEVILEEVTYLEDQTKKNYIKAQGSLFILVGSVLAFLIIATIFSTKIVLTLVRKFRENLHILNNETFSIGILNKKLRAYPKTSACRKAIMAKAKWHKAS